MKLIERGISIQMLNQFLEIDKTIWSARWKQRGDGVFSNHPRRAASTSCQAWNSNFAGEIAFHKKNDSGYLRTSIFGKRFYAHRVMFALYFGYWPNGQVDHIDGDKSNNNPNNLRDVSNQINAMNMPIGKANKTGCIGVHFDNRRKKFIAKFMVGGKTKQIGEFVNLDDAIKARTLANSEYGFHTNHGRKSA